MAESRTAVRDSLQKNWKMTFVEDLQCHTVSARCHKELWPPQIKVQRWVISGLTINSLRSQCQHQLLSQY